MSTDIAIKIRKFSPEDAEFCFGTRIAAFEGLFHRELGVENIVIGIEAYKPDDYIKMSEETEFFIAENNDIPVGFFTIKHFDEKTAEIPLIYLYPSFLNLGIGSLCMRYMEEWIKENWKDVDKIFLDTIIPEYNGGFYRKMGYAEAGGTKCEFRGGEIPAVRFSKKIAR